ncbi:hypothetical protein SK128_005713 [Halocaridina rubra]|uniref:Protein kinase C-terminal domain-containing protein n=1 Tax=Halocaridina rubra TaxID=373956 RepID=A0AAN8XCQ3_HALRR
MCIIHHADHLVLSTLNGWCIVIIQNIIPSPLEFYEFHVSQTSFLVEVFRFFSLEFFKREKSSCFVVLIQCHMNSANNPRLAENFDPAFRNARLEFSPTDKKIMEHLDPDAFHAFTYVNRLYHPVLSEQLLTHED